MTHAWSRVTQLSTVRVRTRLSPVSLDNSSILFMMSDVLLLHSTGVGNSPYSSLIMAGLEKII